ncbi:MAG TPA: hypothetical protein VF791_07400 [Pyrinomonadaceae bacterium]
MKLSRKIEVISNLAIVVVAILLSFTIVKTYLWPTSKSAGSNVPANNVPANIVGRKVSLPDVDWAKNERTLVLALKSDCRFCTESAPFYRELLKRQTLQSNMKLIAVLPNPVDEAKAYLASLGVNVGEVRQASLNSIGVSGTPTLLIVDSSGVVTDAWKGRLDRAGEAEVLSRF